MSDSNRLYLLFAVLLAAGLVAGSAVPSIAEDQKKDQVYGVAIKGYDPVAYFTQDKAIKGKSSMFYVWNEAEWHFDNAGHRDLFAADPKKYAPRHSGF